MANVPLYVQFAGFVGAPPGVLAEVTVDEPDPVLVDATVDTVVISTEDVVVDVIVDTEVDDDLGVDV